MTGLVIVLLETLCCLGLGAAALRVLRIDAKLSLGEHWSLAFAIGFGILGWLVFPLGVAGLLTPGALTALLSVGAFAAVLLRRPEPLFQLPPLDGIGKVLITLLLVVFVFDLMEGIAPPADADTLAYHFAVPKRFVDAERLVFIHQALEGNVPFGVPMTYIPAMALGGDLAATLWTMVSGWAAAFLLFVLCRRHLDVNWSLAVTIVFLSTPAVIFGAGSGQVETRIALFVMVAAWSLVRAIETGEAKYAVLAGLGAGFFAAAKYTGLLFVAVSGLLVVFQRRWFLHGAVFAVAFLAAGFQWYAWNVAYTGDPVFPMLYQWLGRDDLVFWNADHDLTFKAHYFSGENPLPRSPLWLLIYPFIATLGILPLPDAGRVGLGLFGLLILPFAGLGLWQNLDRARRSPLFIYAALAFLFYVLWFFVGGSQRVRHLLPVLPLFLICMTVAAQRLTAEGSYRTPLLAAVVMTLSLQTAVHGLFALNYFKYLAEGMNREAFLERNVNGYSAVSWINANLNKADRIYIGDRQLRYYLEIPSFFGTILQAMVELNPNMTNAQTLYRQLRQARITHFLLKAKETNSSVYEPPLRLLDAAGCLERIKSLQTKNVFSRTLPDLFSYRPTFDVLKLRDESCLT